MAGLIGVVWVAAKVEDSGWLAHGEPTNTTTGVHGFMMD